MSSQFSTFFNERKLFLNELGVKHQAKHEAFLNFLWQKNQAELNIVSRKMSPKELFEKHLLDSFLALPYWQKDLKRVADFGSGGGFPAISLAIENPEQSFFLYEKSAKKQKYLHELVKHLGLENIEIRGVIDDPKDMDLITARAFKPVKEILKLSRRHKLKGGAYFLYKGTLERVKEEVSGLEADIIALDSRDLDMERHIVII